MDEGFAGLSEKIEAVLKNQDSLFFNSKQKNLLY
jgi:hypothetical protein